VEKNCLFDLSVKTKKNLFTSVDLFVKKNENENFNKTMFSHHFDDIFTPTRNHDPQ
jgi:hypothetical protein